MKVRFAPSPTGNLHIGSARTALFNWLLARRYSGTFVLRIEDTDLQRSTKEFEQNILEGLAWLGLDWAEGPGKGLEAAYRQTERIQEDVYSPFTDKLLRENAAYYCYCSAEELEQEREQAKELGQAPGYSGKCRNLTVEQVQQYEREGRLRTVRFKVQPEMLKVHDLIRGEVEFDTTLISDFIIVKADGTPAYNFAVVVDDITMGITHIVRGEDHLPNTPKQIQLYRALGCNPPLFAHLPMILGPDRSKLSKRHGATSVVEYRQAGYLAEALVNYLALLGWSHPEGKEVMPINEITDNFSIERVSKSGAIFDIDKLKWMNGQYIRSLPVGELTERVKPFLRQAFGRKVDDADSEWLEEVVQSVQEKLTVLSDVQDVAAVYFAESVEYSQDLVDAYIAGELSRRILEDAQLTFAREDVFTEEAMQEYINSLPGKFSCGKAKVLKPLRYAVSGEEHGPALVKLMVLLGREKVADRIHTVLEAVR